MPYAPVLAPVLRSPFVLRLSSSLVSLSEAHPNPLCKE
jgi:hypothetical protein